MLKMYVLEILLTTQFMVQESEHFTIINTRLIIWIWNRLHFCCNGDAERCVLVKVDEGARCMGEWSLCLLIDAVQQEGRRAGYVVVCFQADHDGSCMIVG